MLFRSPEPAAASVVSGTVVSGWVSALVVGAMVSATVVWVLERSIFSGDFLQPDTSAAVVRASTHKAAPFRERVLYVIICVFLHSMYVSQHNVLCGHKILFYGQCADAIIADFVEK